MRFLYPGHNYLGPGNPLNNGPPTDDADLIAFKHDHDYASAQSERDIRNSDASAIKNFTTNFLKHPNLPSLTGAAGLSLKYATESVTGVLYPSMSSRGTKRRRPLTPDIREADSSDGSINTPQSESMPDSQEDVGTSRSARSVRAGSGPGAGNSGGGGGTGLTNPPYTGNLQSPNTDIKFYRKEYRFFIQSTPTKMYSGAANADPYIHLVPGSTHDIPWDKIECYLSPRECHFLRTNFTKINVKEVSCTVCTLGVRLPFETNAGVSTTANANVQMMCYDLYNCDQYYRTNTLAAKIGHVLDQMRGDTIYPHHLQAIAETKQFTNITAQFETREFANPLEFLLERPTRTNVDNNIVDALRNKPNEPQLTMLITNSINGSNHLGPCFHHTYQPKN